MKFLRDLFTEPDNITWCLVKVMAGSGIVVFLLCSILHVYLNKTFDYLAFGGGIAALIGGSGLGMSLKKDTPND
jgi:hypothetical protein